MVWKGDAVGDECNLFMVIRSDKARLCKGNLLSLLAGYVVSKIYNVKAGGG